MVCVREEASFRLVARVTRRGTPRASNSNTSAVPPTSCSANPTTVVAHRAALPSSPVPPPPPPPPSSVASPPDPPRATLPGLRVTPALWCRVRARAAPARAPLLLKLLLVVAPAPTASSSPPPPPSLADAAKLSRTGSGLPIPGAVPDAAAPPLLPTVCGTKSYTFSLYTCMNVHRTRHRRTAAAVASRGDGAGASVAVAAAADDGRAATHPRSASNTSSTAMLMMPLQGRVGGCAHVRVC